MKKEKLYTLLSWALLITYIGFQMDYSCALEVDDKLTLRVLKVSATKRTVLINRGIEDGLVVGDHAKFFMTEGVVARGMVIKTSPTRSIWSLYRLVDSKKIQEDIILNLKIATPVKVTPDETRVVYHAPRPIGINVPPTGVLLADGAHEGLDDLTTADRQDLESLEKGPVQMSLNSRTWEVFGMLQLKAFNSAATGTSSDSTSAGTETEGEVSYWDFYVGLEKYFENQKKWFGAFSLYPFLAYSKTELSSLDGRNIRLTNWELGGGVSYHYLNGPHSVMKPIGFFNATVGWGQVEEFSVILSGTQRLDVNRDATSLSFSVGTGFKFFVARGFGGRATIDYYHRSEQYDGQQGSADASYSRITHGVRIYGGLSWRF